MSGQIDRVNGNVDKLGQNIFRENGIQQATLDRIQNFTKANLDLSASSISSLESISSSISRLKSNLASIAGHKDSNAAIEQPRFRRRASASLTPSERSRSQRPTRRLRGGSKVAESLPTAYLPTIKQLLDFADSDTGDDKPFLFPRDRASCSSPSSSSGYEDEPPNPKATSGKVEFKSQDDLMRQLNWGDPRRGPIYDILLTLNKKSLSLIQMSRLCNDNSTVLQDGQRLQNLTWRMLSLNNLSCSTTPKQKSIETRLTKFLDKIFSGINLFKTSPESPNSNNEGFPTVNILEQPLRPCHNSHDKILQNVSPILYPPIIIEYFSLVQKFKSAESCCKQFEILCSHSNRRRIEAGNGDVTKDF
ncbi:MAG: hypothetical protein Q9186_002008 [Xanthomendoza sp. 1 TL-2023]